MEFDEIPACGYGIGPGSSLQQTPRIDNSYREGLLWPVSGRRKLDRNVGLLESRDLVVGEILRIRFMFGAVDQVKMQAVGAFADDHAFLSQSDFGVGSVAEVGHEDIFPDGRSLRGFLVLNVEDVPGKSFIENARLDFE